MDEPTPQPLFLDGPRGRLFAVLYGGDGPAALWLPPFGEEMNRSRRMAALLGRRMAAAGGALLVLDPFGTGDSEGETTQARWADWRADAVHALGWLRARRLDARAVIGLRLGAVLALEAARAAAVPRAVLWQPVVRGRRYLQQVLRIRMAAALAHGDRGGADSVTALRQRLAAGEILEIGGHPMTPEMATDIEALDLGAAGSAFAGRIDWLAVGEAPVVAPRLLGDWRDGRLVTVDGPSFWSTEETTTAPALLSATAALLTETVVA